jgi:hypothetical protein
VSHGALPPHHSVIDMHILLLNPNTTETQRMAAAARGVTAGLPDARQSVLPQSRHSRTPAATRMAVDPAGRRVGVVVQE